MYQKSRDVPSLSLYMQPPSHLHRLLHRSPARWQLQFHLQATLQPQWRSSEHAWLTSDRSVQYGTHSFVLVFHSQPISLGFGISGVLERSCFQIKAATSRARLICLNKAFLVGGMESRDLKLWENMSFLASFTNSALQFLLVYCWHIADVPLLPHLHGLMRPITIAVWWSQIRPVQDSTESRTATVAVPDSTRARIRLCY